jgi:purine-binding chemotaxis protein CheW
LQTPSRFDDADTALVNYLDNLLGDVEKPVDTAKPAVTKVDICPADTPKQQTLQATPALTPTSCQENRDEVDKGGSARQPEPVVPTWAKRSFQVLMFQVSDVMLAVPLTALGGILKWQDGINELPGLPAWVLGLLLEREHKILVVDTAKILMPERTGTLSRTLESGGGYVLLIEGSHWGLAVDGLASTIQLESHQVRWRMSADKRSWLAGVIVEQLSILLDVQGLFSMLTSKTGTYSSART